MAALPIHAPIAEAPLWIRDLGPADEPLLDELHASLSRRSQYQRYHGAKPPRASRTAYLAATDGHDSRPRRLRRPRRARRLGRFVRQRGRPDAADIAAEVVDPRQREGIGTDLVQRLARRAAAVGIRRFTATVMSETGLRRSLARRGWRLVEAEGPSATLEIEVWALLRH